MRTTRLVVRLLAAGLTVGLLAQPGAAGAGTRTVEDSNDTRGKLDLVSASHGHEGRLLQHTLVTQDPWASKLLGPATMTLYFKVGDRYRTLDVGFRDGALFGEICTDERTEGGSFSRCSDEVTLSRPDRTSLRVTLPRRLVGTDITRYRWQALTLLNQGEGRCTDIVCADQLPDEGGWVRHRL